MIYTREIIDLSSKLVKQIGLNYQTDNLAFDYTNCSFVGETHSQLENKINDIILNKFSVEENPVIIVGPMHLTLLQSACLNTSSTRYIGVIDGRSYESVLNFSEDDKKKGSLDTLSLSKVTQVGMLNNVKVYIDPYIGASLPIQIFSNDLSKLVEIFIDESTIKFF